MKNLSLAKEDNRIIYDDEKKEETLFGTSHFHRVNKNPFQFFFFHWTFACFNFVSGKVKKYTAKILIKAITFLQCISPSTLFYYFFFFRCFCYYCAHDFSLLHCVFFSLLQFFIFTIEHTHTHTKRKKKN